MDGCISFQISGRIYNVYCCEKCVFEPNYLSKLIADQKLQKPIRY